MGQSATTATIDSSSSTVVSSDLNPTRRRTLFSSTTFRRNRSGTTNSSHGSSSSISASSADNNNNQQQPIRRNTIFQQLAKRIITVNRRDDDNHSTTDEENDIDERVYSLPMEFIQYRRGWFERHEEYAQQFDQKQVPLLSHEMGLVNSDIIPLILSFLSNYDCCNFSVTCKLVFHYWLGDPWFWFKRTPPRLALHIQKYQPFSLDFVNAKNWRDLAMIFSFRKTWRRIDYLFDVIQQDENYSKLMMKSEEEKVPSYFYFKNPQDEPVVKRLLLGENLEGKSLLKCKNNDVQYSIHFGNSLDDYVAKPQNDPLKTECIIFVNLYTSNGSREMLCLDKFSKHYNRHDFLIVLYYWPQSNNSEMEMSESVTTDQFKHGMELNNWRSQSELNFVPYLEYLDPIKDDQQALSFFQLVVKWKAFNRYLKHADKSTKDKNRGMIENLVLSYCSGYMPSNN